MILNCYHGTRFENAEKIIHDGFDVKKCIVKNDHWLGKGVYFFTEKEYAIWWAGFKRKGVVLKCLISCKDEQYLDLDNINDLHKFICKCRVYLKKYPAKYKDSNQFRATMLDLYKVDNEIIAVSMTFDRIKGTFTEPYHFKTSDFDLIKGMDIKFRQRQVCVSNSNIISNIEKCE